MPITDIDILEDDLQRLSPELLATLLRDHTTQHNILWATSDYETLGDGYGYHDEIRPELITGEHVQVVMPRVLKSKENQTVRSKDMAEVFTPSWVCNAQNNLVDEAWFGRKDVFNIENESDHTWQPTDEAITFHEGKSWKDYISLTRMEITCGEAPYLASRYDTTTGKPIPVGQRIGMLDRKLWLININTPDIEDGMSSAQKKVIHRQWRRYAYKALQSIYGFEWQGDSLLIARETLLMTFVDYYQAKWKTDKLPEKECLMKVAHIISWNLWQMDGLKFGIPTFTPKEIIPDHMEPTFCDPNEELKPEERYCRIMEWKSSEPARGNVLVFKSLFENPRKKKK